MPDRAPIIIIDDDEIIAFLFRRRLPERETVTYRDGREGLEALHAHADRSEPPQAVFVDLHMPVMDGFDFLDRYQAELFERLKDTRVFVMTSSPRDHDRDRCSRYECVDEFIVKPVKTDVLLRLLG